MLTSSRQVLLPPCHIVGGIDVVGVAFAGYFCNQFGANSYQRAGTFVAIVGKLIPQFGMQTHRVAAHPAVGGNCDWGIGVGNLPPRTCRNTRLITQANHHTSQPALSGHGEPTLQRRCHAGLPASIVHHHHLGVARQGCCQHLVKCHCAGHHDDG